MNNEIIDKILNSIENKNDEELGSLIINSITNEDIVTKKNQSDNKYKLFKENKYMIMLFWCRELTDDNIRYILSKLNEKNIGIIETIYSVLSDEKFVDQMIEIGKKDPQVAIKVFKKIDKKILQLVVKKNKNEMLNILELDLECMVKIWEYLETDAQEKMIDKALKHVQNKREKFITTWKRTSPEIQKRKIIQYSKENPKLLVQVWEHTDLELQNELIGSVLEEVKNDEDIFVDILFCTSDEVKESNIEGCIDIVKDNSEVIEDIWNYLSTKSQLICFEKFCNSLKTVNVDVYKKIVCKYVGDVDFDNNNDPIIPQDLIDVIFNKKNIESIAEENNKLLKELSRNLPNIVKKWDEIKKNIQYRRANSKINDDIEIRTNIEAIVSAYKTIEKIEPKTISEIEFDNMPGAEKVGIVTKYTSNVATARKRAFFVANAIDGGSQVKKFPNFSIQDDDIKLKVFPPMDKRPMLMGYDTNCCFRPNGNADEFGDDEYSIYQYCLTEAYGGVFECGRTDLKNNYFVEIYMGTPFYVNGNIMAFNSYETDNGKESKKVNELIEKGAIKAIEKSDGNIIAVVISNLHTGEGSLDIHNKFNMGVFFQLYTEEEYSNYKAISKKIQKPQYLIAAKVDGKILTGDDLYKWCTEDCKGDIALIKRKLGLEFGRINRNYEFAESDSIVYEKKIELPNVVKVFGAEYDRLRDERAIMSLVMRRNELKEKDILSLDEEKILEECNKKLSQLDESILGKYLNLSKMELRNRLAKNSERTYEIYCGNDLKLLANCYGISDEKLKEIVRSKAEERANSEVCINDNTSGKKKKGTNIETGKQKKEKGKLISEIKRKGNIHLNQLIIKIQKGTLNKKDFEKIEQAGISTKSYKESIERVINSSDIEDRNRSKIDQKVAKYIKDEEFIKSVLICEIVGEPSDEMIQQEAIRKTNLTIRNILKEKITKKIIQDRLEEYDDDELDVFELRQREGEMRDRVLNIDKVLASLSSENGLNADEQQYVNELKAVYDIDINEIYEGILKDRNKLVNDSVRKKFDKIQSHITVGLEARDDINKIMSLISKRNMHDARYYNLVYGKKWYIAAKEDGAVDVYISDDVEEREEEKMRETMQKMIEDELDVTIKQNLNLKYEELFCISMESIESFTDEVSVEDVASEIRKIRRVSLRKKDKNINL